VKEKEEIGVARESRFWEGRFRQKKKMKLNELIFLSFCFRKGEFILSVYSLVNELATD